MKPERKIYANKKLAKATFSLVNAPFFSLITFCKTMNVLRILLVDKFVPSCMVKFYEMIDTSMKSDVTQGRERFTTRPGRAHSLDILYANVLHSGIFHKYYRSYCSYC